MFWNDLAALQQHLALPSTLALTTLVEHPISCSLRCVESRMLIEKALLFYTIAAGGRLKLPGTLPGSL